jgi:hypothetical protein
VGAVCLCYYVKLRRGSSKGKAAIAEGLKLNTTLQKLDLRCAQCVRVLLFVKLRRARRGEQRQSSRSSPSVECNVQRNNCLFGGCSLEFCVTHSWWILPGVRLPRQQEKWQSSSRSQQGYVRCDSKADTWHAVTPHTSIVMCILPICPPVLQRQRHKCGGCQGPS